MVYIKWNILKDIRQLEDDNPKHQKFKSFSEKCLKKK